MGHVGGPFRWILSGGIRRVVYACIPSRICVNCILWGSKLELVGECSVGSSVVCAIFALCMISYYCTVLQDIEAGPVILFRDDGGRFGMREWYGIHNFLRDVVLRAFEVHHNMNPRVSLIDCISYVGKRQGRFVVRSVRDLSAPSVSKLSQN